MSIPTELIAYLAAAARRGFDWRDFNCGLFMADWVVERRGIDPAAFLRGLSLRQIAGEIRDHGGFDQLCSHAFGAVGLRLISSARPGDVGVVLAGRRQLGAIRTGKGWAVLTPGGYAVAQFLARAAWEV